VEALVDRSHESYPRGGLNYLVRSSAVVQFSSYAQVFVTSVGAWDG
jgi:hypothetical protein